MAHTYITEIPGGLPPTARGNKYSYIYESKLENDEEEQKQINNFKINNEIIAKIEEKNLEEDEIERKCKSTQKITKITKVTTTRSIKQFPVEPGDLFFDVDGNPIINGFDEISSSSPAGKLSRCSPSEEDFQPSSSGVDDHYVGIDLTNTSSKQISSKNLGEKETPTAPGIPQITECFSEIIEGEGGEDIVPLTISLFWSSPEFNGTAGPLIGYRVEFRRSELEEWVPAHDVVLGANEC
uniref:Fibronectin type-III domain-containing protein n=1 Tax=Meloidogyne hapla TaxID=6305 RepID=A0A1I8B883_MELHA